MTQEKANFSEKETVMWHIQFLEMLPAIDARARYAFRGLGPEEAEERVCEVIARALCSFKRLYEKGEAEKAYASTLAKFAIGRCREGRRVGSSSNSSDLHRASLSKATFGISNLGNEPIIEPSNKHDPVVFWEILLDFDQWFGRQTARNRSIIKLYGLGFGTLEISRVVGVTAARVSQIRSELFASWTAFAP